jgi:hypothetical protein
MVDFLKANPFVTYEQYRWGLSIPMIRLMSVDNTRVRYLSEKEAKKKNAVVVNDANALMNDLGVPVLSREMFEAQQMGKSNNK